ncbi:probable zinc phosphodiesterase ELAC protein 2 [Coccomyxa sp. Obi]|nr:probable zinc phosphodiesterase ELAC protein 2 [Coccomyxa sp. Obi]
MGKKKQGDDSWAINTTSHVQVLGLGTDVGDVAPSVLLFFDKQRYLFNAGEGFQRFAVQHQVKLNRMTDVLLTRTSTDAAGGLPGMCLTLSDSFSDPAPTKVPFRLNIYGPQGAATLVRAVQTFVDRRGVAVQAHEFGKPRLISAPQSRDLSSDGTPSNGGLPPVVSSGAVVITPVQLMPEGCPEHTAANRHATGRAAGALAEGSDMQPPASKRARTDPEPSGTSANTDMEASVQLHGSGKESSAEGNGALASTAALPLDALSQRRMQPSRNWLDDGDAPPLAEQGAAACYICQLAAMPGRFLPDKAVALGVPKGPLFGRLKAGNAVQTADGRTVEPAEVMEEGVPGARVIVADCPSQRYLPSLLRSTHQFQQPESAAAGGVTCVVHLTPAEVLRLPEYMEWMSCFGPTARHIIVAAAQSAGPVAILESSAVLQARLNALLPHIFPLPPPEALQQLPQLHPNMTPGSNLLRFHLRPQRPQPLDSGDVAPPHDAAQLQAEFREQHAGVFEALQRSMDVASTSGEAVPEYIQRAGRESLEILFLGTGAAMPSKYRNVTATYLHMFAHGGILLDCGEGTYGQLRRRYGAAGVDRIITGLKCVWISHIHADHHAGLARVLAVRTALLGPGAAPLPVIGPRPLRRVLAAVSQLEPMAFRYIDTCNTLPPDPAADQDGGSGPREAVEAIKAELNLTRLESFPVVHCAHAFGVAIASADGWSLALSGDTRPCPAVTAAAAGATVLIHEATFGSERTEDGQGYEYEQEAISKRHSMTHEAVAAGREAGAYRTLLTHFSQRYPKIPVIDASFAASTCIAFDLMSVNLQDLPTLPAVVPALQLLFQDSEKEEAAESALDTIASDAEMAAEMP